MKTNKVLTPAEFRRLFKNIQATREPISLRTRRWVNKILKEIQQSC